jgi:hypothetical protein
MMIGVCETVLAIVVASDGGGAGPGGVCCCPPPIGEVKTVEVG